MNQALTALCFDMQPTSVTNNAEEQGVWLPMIPSGTFAGIDKRIWNNANPEQVVARFNKKRPFDIEHSTHIKGPKGEPAPAYGWITEIENRDGEIWGFTEWNEDGAKLIAEKKYAFYSPSFKFDKHGQVIALVSAALTNEPNLDVPALNRMENTSMLLPKNVLDALGLAEDATPEQAEVAINSLKSEKDIALNRTETIDLSKAVPKETYDVALNRAVAAEEELAKIQEKEIEALVDDAIHVKKKVAPANRDMYLSLCRSEGGMEQFKSFVATAPAVVDDKEKDKPPVTTGSKLADHEVAMCRKMGISEEEYINELNKGAK